VLITVVSTLILIVDNYRMIMGSEFLNKVIFYLLIRLLFILVIQRESPKSFGFQLGDWQAGLVITLLAIVLLGPVMWWLGRRDAGLQAYYGNYYIADVFLDVFLDLIRWEFFFRGWLLFGYAWRFGAHALWLQSVPFALVHIGKPELETLSTIFGGFALGWVAWRPRSFLYPFLIHYAISMIVILASAGLLW
jgi:membrane protease YdiL (CAAX protease family)